MSDLNSNIQSTQMNKQQQVGVEKVSQQWMSPYSRDRLNSLINSKDALISNEAKSILQDIVDGKKTNLESYKVIYEMLGDYFRSSYQQLKNETMVNESQSLNDLRNLNSYFSSQSYTDDRIRDAIADGRNVDATQSSRAHSQKYIEESYAQQYPTLKNKAVESQKEMAQVNKTEEVIVNKQVSTKQKSTEDKAVESQKERAQVNKTEEVIVNKQVSTKQKSTEDKAVESPKEMAQVNKLEEVIVNKQAPQESQQKEEKLINQKNKEILRDIDILHFSDTEKIQESIALSKKNLFKYSYVNKNLPSNKYVDEVHEILMLSGFDEAFDDFSRKSFIKKSNKEKILIINNMMNPLEAIKESNSLGGLQDTTFTKELSKYKKFLENENSHNNKNVQQAPQESQQKEIAKDAFLNKNIRKTFKDVSEKFFDNLIDQNKKIEYIYDIKEVLDLSNDIDNITNYSFSRKSNEEKFDIIQKARGAYMTFKLFAKVTCTDKELGNTLDACLKFLNEKIKKN